ncbi:hypothetical protein FEM48_Zijuj08G0110800 [Ziziphus jujuba var. spinosa]|uniref:Reticulon-like protein n=1 Tax=Ziziphus jujuba var. spinosa TaxID=714518 RepID=A0A978UYQ9_ZIZJJ|nr:hypothetical protein FEM48_Zijuj08G0110800 [Ziziphus jujuba var. spinosa]
MFIIVLLFLYGNFLRLLGKEPSALPGLEITEGSALVAANSSRVTVEEISRWMFRVGAEGDLFVFAGVIGGLWILSRIGNNFDLPTFLYIGTVLGMTVPAIYVRYEDKIKRYRERVKEQTRGYYEMINDKVAKMMKHKVPDKEEKEKKVE